MGIQKEKQLYGGKQSVLKYQPVYLNSLAGVSRELEIKGSYMVENSMY
jgi:hypothetical protein